MNKKNIMIISNYNIVEMNKLNLNKLTKSQLIDLLLKDQEKPIPKPRKGVIQMVWEYENLIIPPPPEFRDGYIGGQMPVPKPRTIKPVPAVRTKQPPVPAPRTKVIELPIGAMLKVEKPIPKPRTKKNLPFQLQELKQRLLNEF